MGNFSQRWNALYKIDLDKIGTKILEHLIQKTNNLKHPNPEKNRSLQNTYDRTNRVACCVLKYVNLA